MNEVAIGIWQFVVGAALLALGIFVVGIVLNSALIHLDEWRDRRRDHERKAWHDERPWTDA